MALVCSQPYILTGQAGLVIEVRLGTPTGTVLTSFTAGSNGIGNVTLTVPDTGITILYLVRASDGLVLCPLTIDPRYIAALALAADTRLPNLDASVSSRLPQTAYTSPPTTTDIRTALEATGSSLDTLLSRLSPARANYLDKLNITGNVASSAEVTAIQNNTSTRFVVPDFFERPDAGSTAFVLHLYIYDSIGNMDAPDSLPSISVVNEAGVDCSANLGAVTLVNTGHYKASYTVASNASIGQLIFQASIVNNAKTRLAGGTAFVVDTSAVDFTANDRIVLSNIAGAMALQSSLQDALGRISALPTAAQNATQLERTGGPLQQINSQVTDSLPERTASAIFDQESGVEQGLSVRQALRGMVSVLLSRGGPGYYRDFNDTKDRITFTSTLNGLRNILTRNLN